MPRTALLVGAWFSLTLAGSCAPSVRTEPLPPAESTTARASVTEVGETPQPSPTSETVPTAPPATRAPRSSPPPAERDIWSIAQFEPTPGDDLAAEKAFYSNLRNAWRHGEEVRAFDLITEELALRPARIELRILRAAVALSGVNAGTLPLRLLGGEPVDSAAVSVETLLFVVAEFQRGVPERPPAMVPWTGLYHPHVCGQLIGEYASFWSHGLRPLLRNQALIAGEIEVFEDFDAGSRSLVESLLTAQLLAARGDVERARGVLNLELEEQVAREYVSRWRALVRALDASLNALSVLSAREAHSLLVTWEKQVAAAIPEASGTLLTLPLVVLERVAAERAGGASPSAPAIPDATDVRATLAQAARGRSRAPAAEGESAEHDEMVSEFVALALRLRDFRADSLMRLRSGDTAGVLSDDLLFGSGLRFVENGRRRAAFHAASGVLPPPERDDAGGRVVPCGDGAFVWLAP